MPRRTSILVALALVAIVPAAPAWAGMPVPFTLRDMAQMRLQAISFFLVVLLVSAGLVQWIWNGIRPNPSRLPRLTYFRSLGLVVLWGLLFTVVLAMVSGARELMTPGAWQKQGATYRLKSGG
jgi:hypothetical protein